MANALNLRPSERRLLVGVALVVFVVVNIWFVWPQFGELKRVQKRRTDTLQELAGYEKEIAQIDRRRQEVEQLKSAGADVPRQEQSVEFLRAIQRQASAHRVNTSYSKQSATTNEFFLEQSQGITTVSTEEDLLAFLYDLGSGNSTIRVRDLSVRTDPTRQNLTANVKLVASYQMKPTAAAKRPAPRATARKPN